MLKCEGCRSILNYVQMDMKNIPCRRNSMQRCQIGQKQVCVGNLKKVNMTGKSQGVVGRTLTLELKEESQVIWVQKISTGPRLFCCRLIGQKSSILMDIYRWRKIHFSGDNSVLKFEMLNGIASFIVDNLKYRTGVNGNG